MRPLFLFLCLALVASCAAPQPPWLGSRPTAESSADSHVQETELSEAEVISISNRLAKALGYDLRKYEPADARYQYAQADESWWIYYQRKPRRPTHHFSMFVHDKTKRITIYPPQPGEPSN